ncbi:hypothetical protein L7F22_025865 [Adiantum nelumboides]|nr:hypothetical protein [Adiantum nelumboides]
MNQKGIAPGGFNFDAKLRRESVDLEDLFIAHIAGMDTMARGLRNAAKIIEDGALKTSVDTRYASYESPLGKAIKVGFLWFSFCLVSTYQGLLLIVQGGKVGFEELEQEALSWEEPPVPSGKQELAEMIFYSFI